MRAGGLGTRGQVMVGRRHHVSSAQVRAELCHHVQRLHARRAQHRPTPGNTQTAPSTAVRTYFSSLRHQRCADPEILSPRQSAEFDGSAVRTSL